MRLDRSYIRKIRYGVQWAVVVTVLAAGYHFFLFTKDLEHGVIPSVSRPPAIEGFLPIGSLMSLKLWISEGIFDPVHPAALVIFSGALLLSAFLKKSFCSWICPVGTISEAFWNIGKKGVGKNFALPRPVDCLLRSLKYILMAFFLFVILIRMSPSDIIGFLNTPYWKVTDIKLLKFFTEMSAATGMTLAILLVLSLFVKNFWCRYLCPYGALLGLLSIFSPVSVKRDERVCIHCGACSRNCPALLPVEEKSTIRSPECTGCLTCVSCCPAEGTLNAAIIGRKPLHPLFYVAVVVVIFFGIIVIAKATGRWNSSLSSEELLNLVPFLDRLSHP